MINCKECFWDIRDKENPDYKECSAEGVDDSIFDKYGDDELPQHCGQFTLK